jgi:hypothetical protein
MEARRRSLDTLRTHVRRIQLIAGLGLFSVAIGAVVSSSLLVRLHARMVGEGGLFRALLFSLIAHLWVLALLPGLSYLLARIIELRPWSTAMGAVASGTLFALAIELISGGMAGLLSDHPARLALRVGCAVAGVVLTWRAVLAGRAAAEAVNAEARRKAEDRQQEYAEFAAQAERLAAQTERKEAGAEPPRENVS